MVAAPRLTSKRPAGLAGLWPGRRTAVRRPGWVAAGLVAEAGVAAMIYANVSPFDWVGVPGASAVLVAAAVLTVSPRGGIAVAAFGGILVGIVLPAPPLQRVVPVLFWTSSMAVVAYGIAVQQRLRHEAEAERRRALALLVEGEQAQRRQLATALHDDTIQVLAAALIQLERLRGKPAKPGAVERTATTVREALERTRRMTFALFPPLLADRGLDAALPPLLEELACGAGWTTHCDVAVGRLAPHIEEIVYRVVREALVNARKHASASSVSIALERRDDIIEGSIVDDGVGFAGHERRDAHLHMGLRSMRERVEIAGGALRVEAAPGTGTAVMVSLPVQRAGPVLEPA
jgi:signal transduction histidine kinase